MVQVGLLKTLKDALDKRNLMQESARGLEVCSLSNDVKWSEVQNSTQV